MFYPVFAVFMILVVIYIAAAVIEYGTTLAVRGSAGILLFGGALILLGIALWWAYDATRAVSPTRGIELLRAVVFLLLSGPVLTAPPLVARTVGGGDNLFISVGRLRRMIWRPASIIGLVLIVLWFLS
ncbi:MAG: hypothetical protein LC793_09165 [Thermomicrobia bacterium]|nr:hypothetical protein [Thermomicrobia bacterium]MCA1723970.1 hypothetical protein [Thermomicrobia bacterium]